MIKAGFIFLTAFMAALVYVGAASVATRIISNKLKRQRFKTTVALMLTLWLVYVSLLSLAGVFTVGGLPPRIPLLLILPAFAFMTYFFRSQETKDLIAATPASWLVYAQSFRVVVELMLHGLFLEGVLPKAGTYEGYNYEIVIGISAIAVGYLGYTRRVLPRIALIIWNGAGLATLAIIVFIMISHAYFPGIYSNPEKLNIADFGSFPYTLLAGFLMPLAVFMHVFSLKKLANEK